MSSGSAYLRTLPAVRARCSQIYEIAQKGQLEHIQLHAENYDKVVEYCAQIMTRDYGTSYSSIPPHARWRHFRTPTEHQLLDLRVKAWEDDRIDRGEIAKRLIDLLVVSVLLDAGAGDKWSFKARSGEKVGRSEGLAVASLEMFQSGLFSDDPLLPHQVTATCLAALTTDKIAEGLQVTPENPMEGLQGRTQLLFGLSKALESNPAFFGEHATIRPGNMLDYLSRGPEFAGKLNVSQVWTIVMEGFAQVWPSSRTQLDGVPLGDAWPSASLARKEGVDIGSESSIVPFHKLSQWLTYSILQPMEEVLGWRIEGGDQMTGLPEYRNGGLLLDLGLVTLTPKGLAEKQSTTEGGVPIYDPGSQTVTEWRAVTVIALDIIAQKLRVHLNAPGLSTAQVLESATWKAGREIAAASRPNGGPPLAIISDGTLF